ncbi:MAG: hypothetical protein DRJ03_17950 [Chloroflexi bacterium]|nr:MAG: hypothetical protein DRI81_13960 [Chloroflexota bacterium]RLC83146.1 MAG: hypothetical protein DRJ03_17950 [Chloroflexota bacterium]
MSKVQSVVKVRNIGLANEGGRLRWKIENEGFNVQKNGGYGLEHAYTRDLRGLKFGSTEAFPSRVGSAKNIALRLPGAWRNLRLIDEQLHHMLSVRVQIRFKPP